MPTSSIHAIVAKKIANIHTELDNYDYYLGSIAPDSVNLYGFAEKEERWNAHLRDKDLDVWTNNIVDFYNQEKNNIPLNFLKGYITHIMTDIIYDKSYYLEVRNKIEEMGIDRDRSHTFMQTEMKIYGVKKEDYIYVRNFLDSMDKGYNIRNIEENEMIQWKNKIIHENIPDLDATIFNDDIVERLFQETLKVLEERNIL
ncbi:MAG: hypothetical protein IJ193_05360 [Bacilli bacterium]|nr:hypothetical protein [Bacilli bacterium]